VNARLVGSNINFIILLKSEFSVVVQKKANIIIIIINDNTTITTRKRSETSMKGFLPPLIYSRSVSVRKSYTIYNLRATQQTQKCLLLAGKHSQISPCGNHFSTLNKC